MAQLAGYDSDDDPIPSLEYSDDEPLEADRPNPRVQPNPRAQAPGYWCASLEEFHQMVARSREDMLRKAWSSPVTGSGSGGAPQTGDC